MSVRALSWRGCGCSRDRRLPWLAFLAAVLTCVPYLVAWLFTPPGHVFSGFLLASQDSETYLFKIRLGEMGLWWENWYSPRPGPPVRLFWPYIVLGRLGGLLGVPAIVMFHLGRMVAAFALALGLFALARELGVGPWWVPLAGLFWCGPDAFVVLPPVPEMRAAWAALALPHFALCQAAACWCLVFWLRARRGGAGWALAAGAACAVVSSVHPYMAALPAGACGIDAALRVRTRAWAWRDAAARWLPVVCGSAAGAAWVAREILRQQWVREWLAQSRTPANLLAVMGALAPEAVLCAAGVREWVRCGRRDGRMLGAAWVGLTAVLCAVPVVPGLDFRRRYLEGLAPALPLFPVLGAFVLSRKHKAAAIVLVAGMLVGPLALCVRPVVLGAGDPVAYLPRELDAAFRWLAEAAPGSVVVSDPATSNRIPSRAMCRTVAGHWSESPGYRELAPVLRGFFSEGNPRLQRAVLERFRPDYVLWRCDAFPAAGLEAVPGLEPVWECGPVAIFAWRGG